MSPRKILIIQTGFPGDIILSTPTIAAMHSLWPDARLSLLTTPAGEQLLRHDPLLDEIIVYDKRNKDRGFSGFRRLVGELRKVKFDRAYSLHRSYRSTLLCAFAGIRDRRGFADAHLAFFYHRVMRRPRGVHDVLRRLSILGPEWVDENRASPLRLFPPDASECSDDVQKLVSSGSPYAMLFPGSEWETKRWDWTGFRDVACYLEKRGLLPVLSGAPKEADYISRISSKADVLNLAGRTSIPELLFLVKNAAMVVSNDSMPIHAASAFHVPTVVIFCATSPDFGFGPWKNTAIIVEKKGLACRPCRPHGSRRCPTGTEKCMKDLPATEVIGGIERLVSVLQKAGDQVTGN